MVPRIQQCVSVLKSPPHIASLGGVEKINLNPESAANQSRITGCHNSVTDTNFKRLLPEHPRITSKKELMYSQRQKCV